MLAGARDEATLRVSSAARGWGAPAAALVFGTAAHALDYDDNYHPMAGHATAVLAPAIFALAESRPHSSDEPESEHGQQPRGGQRNRKGRVPDAPTRGAIRRSSASWSSRWTSWRSNGRANSGGATTC